jgi:hypothetical protein
LNGPAPYYTDGVKKSSNHLMSDLKGFIGSVNRLKDAVNDPANIMGDVLIDLNSFKDAFKARTSNDVETMWNDPGDKRDHGILVPNDIAPTTQDHNVIAPDLDFRFPVPSPKAPNQFRQLRASAGAPSSAPDLYAQAQPKSATRLSDTRNIRVLSRRVIGAGKI